MRTNYHQNSAEENIQCPIALELALANGGDLDESSLLLIILGRHLPYHKACEFADKLLVKFGNLATLIKTSFADLQRFPTMKREIALDIVHLHQLLQAVSKSAILDRVIIDRYDKLIEFCEFTFNHVDHEQFHAFYLNKKCELLDHECLQKGTVDHVTIYPRHLLGSALKISASYIILSHNHPYGKAKPSRADITMTGHLSALAEAMGITIFDHIIIAGNKNYSFRQNGLLKPSKSLELSPDRLSLLQIGKDKPVKLKGLSQ